MKKEQLSSLIKSARDIMRKDRNLDTDVKRIPTLSWLFFLKCFDDLEQRRKTESILKGKPFRPAIEKPYRWQDWAADEAGITGDELLRFINNDLFPYLKRLTGTNEYDQRDVISALFREITNEARSGYLLRDVINLVNKLNFNSADDIHTLSHVYESMLRELRDAAGQNGEFYTPRPVVRFIVEMIAPELGETVLDPAAGTGGFLVEAYEYLKQQQKKAEDREVLQYQTLYGIEKKPMPYLLGTMNLLLHGIERPNYQEINSLAVNLNDITDSRRYDCIITNPPFGGEEEVGIKSGFPEDKQTAETALLFLQFIMRSLRRPDPTRGIKGGRCGMVVPNGTLFGGGVCARIKKELVEEFNLHTIVRLPQGVFAPYTGIQTNLLFFERNGPTKEIWYYEHPLPEGRKNYTKTKPLRDVEFEPLKKWWNNRSENEHAWCVPVNQIVDNEYNLDIKNPNSRQDLEHLPPEQLVDNILKKEQHIVEIMDEIRQVLAEGALTELIMSSAISEVVARAEKEGWIKRQLREICQIVMGQSPPGHTYNERGEGLPFYQGKADFGKLYPVPRKWCSSPKKIARENDILISVRAPVGPTNLCREDSCIGRGLAALRTSNEIDFMLLLYFLHYKEIAISQLGQGSTFGAIGKERLGSIEIPVPPKNDQRRIVDYLDKLQSQVDELRKYQTETQKQIEALSQSILAKAFRGEL